MKKFFGFVLVLAILSGTVYFLAIKGSDSLGIDIPIFKKDSVIVDLPKAASELSQKIKTAVKEADSQQIEDIISFVKDKSQSGELTTEEGIKNAIEEAESRFGTLISDRSKEEIAESLINLENMGFSTDVLIDKVEALYMQYGEDFLDHMEEAFVDAAKEAAGKAAQNIWNDTKDSLRFST